MRKKAEFESFFDKERFTSIYLIRSAADISSLPRTGVRRDSNASLIERKPMPANRVESIGGYAYQIKRGSNEPRLSLCVEQGLVTFENNLIPKDLRSIDGVV